jgi:hypothetical protein
MPLRREIHLILWVSALALLSAMILRATLPASSDSWMEANLTDTAIPANSGNEGQGSSAFHWSRQLTESPGTAPTLFPMAAGPVEVVSPPEGAPDTAPVLKGVVQSDRGMLAVFLDPGSGTYRTLGVGDTIGAYRIVAVEADQVSMFSPRGDEFFQLRGPGEHP